jgi:chemotaxis protein MotB
LAKPGANQIQEEDDDPSAPFWMTTFSDMATLLLTFFIMIVSMSTVEIEKFKEAMSYFQGSTSVLQQASVTPPIREQIVSSQPSGGETQEVEQANRYESVLEYLEQQGLQDKVQVNMTEEGLHVVIVDSLMFTSGSAELLPQSRSILGQLAALLTDAAKAIIVEGHTDDQPIATAAFPSNWELSSARAMSVVRFLLEQSSALDPSEYIGRGHGEYRPVDTNLTSSGRARNRRVEILFSWQQWQNSISPQMTTSMGT